MGWLGAAGEPGGVLGQAGGALEPGGGRGRPGGGGVMDSSRKVQKRRKLSGEARERLCRSQDWKCAHCEKERKRLVSTGWLHLRIFYWFLYEFEFLSSRLPEDATEVDHITALCDWDSNHEDPNHPRNLQALCSNCHSKKSSKERRLRRETKPAADV